MRYFLVAGEASGDLHASNLVKSLRTIDPEFEAKAWGGDRLHNAGVNITKHLSELAFMGFAEVAKNIGTILRNLKQCQQEILDYHPHALILVDYPGFNLRLARFAKQHGIDVYYYISPTVWAWKKNRMFQIRDNCKRLYTILPFEQEFYAKEGIEVSYEGHPLMDEVLDFRSKNPQNESINKPYIALLPGSRKQEIDRMLPLLVSLAKLYPNYEWKLAGAPGLSEEHYSTYLKDSSIQLVFGQTYSLLQQARAAVVGSGTATLETALFHVPQVVIYKTSPINFFLAKQLVKVSYISLVNLIMQKPVVKELIQEELDLTKLQGAFNRIVNDTPERAKLISDYRELEQLLGGGGASYRVASSIYAYALQS